MSLVKSLFVIKGDFKNISITFFVDESLLGDVNENGTRVVDKNKLQELGYDGLVYCDGVTNLDKSTIKYCYINQESFMVVKPKYSWTNVSRIDCNRKTFIDKAEITFFNLFFNYFK